MFKKTTGGSAWPTTQCRLSADRVKIVQSKMNVSRGLDKGCCAACLLGEDGCDEDDRAGAGVMGKCGWAHQGPKDQQAQFYLDVATTSGFKVPYSARNYRFWQNTPSGHAAAEAKQKRSSSPAPDTDDDKSE